MATLMWTTRLFAAVATSVLAAGSCASVAGPFTLASVTSPSAVRPDFTRPGGIPGSARSIAATKQQYMLAPAQPADPTKTKKRKLRYKPR